MLSNAPKPPAIGRFFNFIFNLLYNQFAWSYDLVAWIVSGGLWKKWVLTTLDQIPDNSFALELGSGPGHLLTQGLLHNKNITGVDISHNMAKRCAKRLSDANLPIRITQADSMKLPFRSDTFLSVIATFPAPYIFHSKTLVEIHRVLQSNGVFVIVPTAWSTSKGIPQRFFSWLLNLSNSSTNHPDDSLKNILEKLEYLGFSPSYHTIDVEKSKVLHIYAVKHQ